MKHQSLAKSILVLIVLSTAALVKGQTSGSMEERIEVQRIAFITQHVNLTPNEAQTFWPLYHEYQTKEKDLKKLKKRPQNALDMTEEETDLYINRVLDLEQQELDLRRAYKDKFRQILSARKTYRLFEAERRFKERLLQIINQRRKKTVK